MSSWKTCTALHPDLLTTISYNGKSTGKGALSLWMRNLKTTETITNYQSKAYNGPAIKLGAGVLVGETYEAAAAEGYRAVGGECGSVGISGGYSQGGGHSILNSKYGMGTDQVLEWEVVTARGEHLIATPEQNTDLYWALSGGGGGTYGVVLSMTTRLHQDGPFTGGSLGFTLEDAGNNATAYWTAVSLWFQKLPSLTEDGRTLQFVVFNNSFQAIAINLPDVDDSSAVQTLLEPYTAELDDLKITYNVAGTVFTSFLDYFNSTYGPLPYGPEPPDTILTSRLIPRSSVVDGGSVTPLVEAIHATVSDGTFLFGCSAMSLPNVSHPDNAVLPAWRDSIAICNVNAYWQYTEPLETNLNVKKILTEQYQPLIEAATPGSGVYLNEIDPWYTGDWKEAMYGVNYDRLLEIKHQNDPDHLFYGHFAVGGDEFTEDGDGRLCRVN